MRGSLARNDGSTDGSAARCSSRIAACVDWPPMVRMDGATISTRTGREMERSRERIASVDFARLRRMSGAEIYGRGRQRALIWMERLGAGPRPGPAGRLDLSALAPDPRSAPLVAALDPDGCAAIVAAADRALEGR